MGQNIHDNCLPYEDTQRTHPVTLESLDIPVLSSPLLWKSLVQLDYLAYTHMGGGECAPPSREQSIKDLCNYLAMIAKRICTSDIDTEILSPMLACHSMTLDKSPGCNQFAWEMLQDESLPKLSTLSIENLMLKLLPVSSSSAEGSFRVLKLQCMLCVMLLKTMTVKQFSW